MTEDHTSGDNPEGSIKVKYIDDEDDGNDSDDDSDNVMGVDGSYNKRKMNHKEDYIPSHGGNQYKQGIIHIQTQGKYCDMSDDDKENYMLGIIMAQYILKEGLNIFGTKGGGNMSLMNFHRYMI